MAKEYAISNIAEYIKTVCELNDSVRKVTYIRDFVLLFRGQANKDFELIPSLGRNRRFATQCTIFNEERNLIEMAKFRLPDVFRADLTPVELLALLQHHGIPTRLLDVTENALVALYFACCSAPDKDAEVIVFKSDNNDVANYPITNAIADSYRFTGSTWTRLSLFYSNVKTQPYFLEQQHRMDIIHQNDDEGGQWIAECCKKLFFLYAPVRSMRQQAQHGRYILFPNDIERIHDTDCFAWRIKAIPKEHEDISARIIVPATIKQQLLQDLSILGITESFLFCDSVDTVCKGIVDSFKRRF